MIERARSEIEQERDQAVQQLRNEFAGMAIAAAERVIEQSLDADDHQQLIADVLAESSNGQQN